MVSLSKFKDLLRKTGAMANISYSDLFKLAGSLIEYTGMGEPDVLLGPVPLYNCTYFDVSMSQDILKFRAVEAQFLAHQPATSYAMRIDFVVSGKFSVLVQAIAAMYYLGAAIPAYFTPVEQNLVVQQAGQFPDALARGKEISEDMRDRILSDIPSDEVMKKFWDLSSIRFTFPVISKSFILYGMYIESYFWSRNVEEGDIIKGSVLLRKYIPPPKKFIFRTKITENTVVNKLTTVKSDKLPKGASYVLDARSKKGGGGGRPGNLQKSFAFQDISGRIMRTVNRAPGLYHGMIFNYPGMVTKDNTIYSFGESNYYKDMMDYITRDASMQFIYYIMSKSEEWFVRTWTSSSFEIKNSDKYFDILSNLFTDLPEKVDQSNVDRVIKGGMYQTVDGISILFEDNGRIIATKDDKVIAGTGYLKTFKILNSYLYVKDLGDYYEVVEQYAKH